jgi:hypothetical protein
MRTTDLTEMQQYYETQVTLKEVVHKRGRETKNLNRIDLLLIQE